MRTVYAFGGEADLSLIATLNGSEAPPPGPSLTAGLPVTMAVHLHNTGNLNLISIAVEGGDLLWSCPAGTLAPGAMLACSASADAEDGTHEISVRATASSALAAPIERTGSLYCTGISIPPPTGHRVYTPFVFGP